MDTTTLQVPLSKSLKTEARLIARDYGFSSLSDLIRFLLTKLTRRELVMPMEKETVRMSKRAEKRYGKMMKDFQMGRNVKSFASIEDLTNDLSS